MNIAVAVKVVPDDQDIAVAADRTLDYSKAHQVVSEYDLNAIEAAALLAEDAGAAARGRPEKPRKRRRVCLVYRQKRRCPPPGGLPGRAGHVLAQRG